MAIKSKDVLMNLSKDKLKAYIFYLTQKYYNAFMQNDVKAYELAVEQLFFITEEYEDKFVNLDGFICFCFYINANAVLMNEHVEQAFELEPLFKMSLLEDDVEELPFDMRNIFNKQRIKERYYEKGTREPLEKP